VLPETAFDPVLREQTYFTLGRLDKDVEVNELAAVAGSFQAYDLLVLGPNGTYSGVCGLRSGHDAEAGGEKGAPVYVCVAGVGDKGIKFIGRD
jgi:hypothetical protein